MLLDDIACVLLMLPPHAFRSGRDPRPEHRSDLVKEQ
jgi:hypothetical protein